MNIDDYRMNCASGLMMHIKQITAVVEVENEAIICNNCKSIGTQTVVEYRMTDRFANKFAFLGENKIFCNNCGCEIEPSSRSWKAIHSIGKDKR